ncbi:MAG: hypothetical protein IKJ41_01295 [Clostridia bacterium]|nr:hypothetical protein [Clostridia bacterium]
MLSKRPEISKELIITGIIIFAAFNFASLFSFMLTTRFVARNVFYMLIASLPFAVYITSRLSENFRKNIKAVDIAAIVTLGYTFLVILRNGVMRYDLLITVGIVSLSLLLCGNIYTLPVAAIINLIASFKFGYSATMSVPAAICLSMVCFSYIFKKQKAVSKKKAKKAENLTSAPDYKKEKIIFAISEIILFISLGIMIYYRQTTIALITFMSNIEYIIPCLILAACFVIFAVLSIKNKKPLVEVIGYLVAVATMPLTQLCEYSVAAGGVFAAFMLLLALLDNELDSGRYAQSAYKNIISRISKAKKTSEV